MGLLLDLHVHTKRHSACSQIEPQALIAQAVKKGLDGLVITEHHYQWTEEELADLRDRSDAPGFLLLAGFECSSSQGDILIYGLEPAQAAQFQPGAPPADIVAMACGMNGVCVGAHPTRAGMGFDEHIHELSLDAIEVLSVNMREHEQRLAMSLARASGLRPLAASDAHRINDVGRYVSEFDDVVRSTADLQAALRRGRFRPVDNGRHRAGQ